MIVNVNPFDTGYDENSHVMKFAALAREVYITPAPAPTRRLPTSGIPSSPVKAKSKLAMHDTESRVATHRRSVTISLGGKERKMSEAVVEILEGMLTLTVKPATLNNLLEDEQNDEDDGDSDGEPINPLVDALFDEIEELRRKVGESRSSQHDCGINSYAMRSCSSARCDALWSKPRRGKRL
jgi:kinesin family member 20